MEGESPQPPPMRSIHLDDATTAILRQNAHHTPAYWYRGDRLLKFKAVPKAAVSCHFRQIDVTLFHPIHLQSSLHSAPMDPSTELYIHPDLSIAIQPCITTIV
ncbi:uncharacterized [Tachysurus ichikawai]